MTVDEWAKDFRSFVNELKMPRDDYKGIMEYIDDALSLLKEQEAVVRCKDCKIRGNINLCPLAYIEKTEQFTALCVDEWFCGSGKRKEVK